MRNRQVWLVVLGVALIGLLITGCGQPAAAPATSPPAAEAVQEEAAVEDAPAEVATEETTEEVASEEAADGLRVAVFHGGPISDEGWDMLFHQAMLSVEETYTNVETAYVENQPYSGEATRTLEQLATDGADIIFLTTEYADLMYEAAARHPDTIFLECNGHKAEGNVSWFYVEHWDPSYLIGMAAGLMTETNKLGYIGSFPFPSVYTSVNSFHLGAQSVNPDVTTSVVLVNSWFDPAAERQAAEALIESGVDMLFGIMGTPVYLQVAEEQGVMAAVWTVPSAQFGPNAYISSVLSDWVYYYDLVVGQYLEGNLDPSQPTLLGIGEGTDRDEWGQNVPEDVRQQVDAVREQMMNEDLNVFVGPIYDAAGELRVAEGEEMDKLTLYQSWDWAVQGVQGMP